MMLKNFEPRLYQETIFSTCSQSNTLVVLPTGLGKTAISLMLACQRLKLYPNSKILILAPTKPLLDQHLNVFKAHMELSEDSFQVFSGEVTPASRKDLWESKQIFFSTPQTIENDLISGKMDLKNVSMICFDECHRATGDYSYVFLAKQYDKQSRFPRILGLTASPGSDMESINEIIQNLLIEKIEIRTDEDADVKQYVWDVVKEYYYVDLPESMLEILKFLKMSYKSKLEKLREIGFLGNIDRILKRDLLTMQANFQGQIAQGDKSFDVLKAISFVAEALKVEHAVELAETQGLTSLLLYIESIFEQSKTTKVKAVINLSNDIHFRSAYIKTKEHVGNFEHPKLDALKKYIIDQYYKNPDVKIIVFSNFRDAAAKIEEQLLKEQIKCKIFVGQAAKKGIKGMTQKEQIGAIEDFRSGVYNVLIMTSVGEEGLDIPQVDMVIFYEPIPSVVRTVQRRGRTGRQDKGKVVFFLTKGTRDESYHWAAHHKENRMNRILQKLRNELGDIQIKKPKYVHDTLIPKDQETLNTFVAKEEKYKIFADTREKGSNLLKELADKGVNIELSRLESADYILSKNVGVELKKVDDFVNSIIDGRLLLQIKELKNNFSRPLIVIEGDQDIYTVRNIHPNAIRGMLATIAISYGIPIIQTKHFKETAALFEIIARRELEENGKIDFAMHTSKPADIKYQQEYLVSSLPNVGTNLAKELLGKFKTVKNIINASEDELKEVHNLGDKKASSIKNVIETEYDI